MDTQKTTNILLAPGALISLIFLMLLARWIGKAIDIFSSKKYQNISSWWKNNGGNKYSKHFNLLVYVSANELLGYEMKIINLLSRSNRLKYEDYSPISTYFNNKLYKCSAAVPYNYSSGGNTLIYLLKNVGLSVGISIVLYQFFSKKVKHSIKKYLFFYKLFIQSLIFQELYFLNQKCL